jgi:hypothetical protein
MKKVSVFLSIFIFSFAFVSCQKENIDPAMKNSGEIADKSVAIKPLDRTAANQNGNTKTRYEVVVHLSTEQSICNSYLVELKDETGRYIGPSQKYTPEISVYNFYETVSASGTRIARLVEDPDTDRLACPNDLFTPPAIQTGNFIQGSSYTFDLYPQTTPQKLSD